MLAVRFLIYNNLRIGYRVPMRSLVREVSYFKGNLIKETVDPALRVILIYFRFDNLAKL